METGEANEGEWREKERGKQAGHPERRGSEVPSHRKNAAFCDKPISVCCDDVTCLLILTRAQPVKWTMDMKLWNMVELRVTAVHCSHTTSKSRCSTIPLFYESWFCMNMASSMMNNDHGCKQARTFQVHPALNRLQRGSQLLQPCVVDTSSHFSFRRRTRRKQCLLGR